MNKEFFIGQVFEEMYPVEASDWANENKAQIIEIDPVEKEIDGVYQMVRSFRIVPDRGPTQEQQEARVLSVRDYYFDIYVDWYQSRPLLWSELTKKEKDDIKAYRIYLKEYDDQENWWEQDPLDFETWKKSK